MRRSIISTKSPRRLLATATAAVSLAFLGSGASRGLAATAPIYDLGTLGGAQSQGKAINASAQVVGVSNTTGGAYHAFLQSSGTIADLSTLGGASSYAVAINTGGQITGSSQTSSSDYHAFVYSGVPGSDGAMTDLGTLGGANSTGTGINDSALIVGASSTSGGGQHAFLYSAGVMIDLGTLGGADSQAFAINNSSLIVGQSATQGSGTSTNHAFLYSGIPGQGGAMADLGTLSGGTSSGALAINSTGQIAGWSGTATGQDAFLYTGTPGLGGSMADLGSLGGSLSQGLAINDQGQVAGYSYLADNATQHAFLYVGTPGIDGKMIDLNAWLGANNPAMAASWTLQTATGINDSGLITGWGDFSNGSSSGYHAFVLDASSLLPDGRPWIAPGSGNWNTPANWNYNDVPGAIADRINFGNSIGSAAATVTLTGNETVGLIAFTNSLSGRYTIAASNGATLTIDDTGDFTSVKPRILVTGSNAISAPLVLHNGVNISFTTGAQLTISNKITGSGPTSLAGAGTLLVANSGLLNPASALSINGAATLVLSPGAMPSTPIVQTVASLNFDNVPGSRLDIGNNEMVITGTASPEIRADIRSGNIISSSSDATHGVGYIPDSAGTEIRFTVLGDTNLDGAVNFSDLLSVATNYGASTATWAMGDFNYDNTVNFSDLLTLAANYGSSLSPQDSTGFSPIFVTDWNLAVSEVASSVPEPTSLAILTLGAPSLLTRRRRNLPQP